MAIRGVNRELAPATPNFEALQVFPNLSTAGITRTFRTSPSMTSAPSPLRLTIICAFSSWAVQAAPVSDGGLGAVWPGGIEATQTLDTISVGTGNFGTTSGSNVNEALTFSLSGLNTANAVGTLRTGGAPDLQLDFGNGTSADTLRATIRMQLGSQMRLGNVTGDDLWITEGGGPDQPEAFMVRVSIDNAASWSSWEYRFSEVQYNPDGNGTVAFFTGFDFVTDFGLAPSATVSHIELQNAIAADRVNAASGQGTVILGGGSGFVLSKGPQGAGAVFGTGNFDADIGYVFYAQAVPEPSVFTLLGLSALAMVSRRRKR